MPKMKKEGGTLFEWFEWYHATLKAGFKCTLKEVANESHYSYGYVKLEHAKYAHENASTLPRPNQNT